MRKIILSAIAALCLCFAVPSHQKAQVFWDFDSCFQSSDCSFQCYFHSINGNYKLTTTHDGYVQVNEGLISTTSDDLLITDHRDKYTIKIYEDKGTHYATVSYHDGSRTIVFSGYVNPTCSCQ